MPKKTKNVLAVGAHADDVEIGCGGTVALHARNGDNVIILIMAESSYTYYDGTVLRSKEEGEIEERNAARILGAKELINLGFKTKEVPYSVESIEAINEIIDKYNIDIIYTHWYHDTHQDHKRTTQSVLAAGRYVRNILMYEPEYPAGRSYLGFRNQYYVDITATFDKDMDPNTINANTFLLTDENNNPVAGTVSYDAATRTATFDPTDNLDYNVTYTAIITAEVKDSFGNSLSADYSWSFTTAEAPPPAKGPDLIVTDIWRKGTKAYFQVMNIGDQPAGDFEVALLINRNPVDSTAFKGLNAGERAEGSFDLPECPGPTFTIGIWADVGKAVPEADEENNIRTEEWKCDEEAPQILNIEVIDVGADYAEIGIKTDEKTKVRVDYGRSSAGFEGSVEATAFSTEHVMRITKLLPSTLYRFIVTATDRSENETTSKEKFFRTSSVPDGTKPTIGEITVTKKGNYWEFRAPVSDESGISRVEFYLDGRMLGSVRPEGGIARMSFLPSMFGLSKAELYRDHILGVKVFDTTGLWEEGSEPWRPSYEVERVEVRIDSPSDGYIVKAGRDGVVRATTYLDIEIYAAEYEMTARRGPGFYVTEFIPHPVRHVELYIYGPNDYEIKQTFRPYSDEDLTFTYSWNMTGLTVGIYSIFAVAYSTDGGTHFSDSVTVYVQPLERNYDFNVSIERIGNYFNVTLKVHNTGDLPITLERIEQHLKGFQPVEKDGSDYDMEVAYDPLEKKNIVTFSFNSVTVAPGERKDVASYLAVPIMYPEPIYRGMCVDGIRVTADGETRNFYTGFSASFVDENGIRRWEDIAQAAHSAFGESDYLIVTDPENLYALNNEEHVNNLLSAMAELAVVRNGVIGYVDSGGAIRAKIRDGTAFATGDPNGNGTTDIIFYHPEDEKSLRIWESGHIYEHELEEIEGEEAKAMCAADLDGDGRDEIIMALKDHGYIKIFGKERQNGGMEYIEEYQVPSLLRLEGESLSCGYIHPSIPGEPNLPCCVYPREGEIVTFSLNPVTREIEANFYPAANVHEDDLVFVGDAYLGEPEEIIVLHSDGLMEVYTIDISGNLVIWGSLQTDYSPGDYAAWGDVDGDGEEELLVSKKDQWSVLLYDADGLKDSAFGRIPKGVLGDILGGAEEEIITPGEDFIYYTTWRKIKEGDPLSTTLITRWGQKLKEGWLSNGYLLIVGETEIIPACSWTFDPVWLDWGSEKHIPVTDLPYANTEGNVIDPELIVGRIIGDTASELMIPIETAIKVARGEQGYSFDRSHALILIGFPETREGGADHIDFEEGGRTVGGILSDDYGMRVSYIRTPVYDRGDEAVDAFFRLTPGKDVIHLEGHGSPTSLDDISKNDVIGQADPFGEVCPLVFAESCNTGDYTHDTSLAEAFLQKGAAVYIGSTATIWGDPWGGACHPAYFYHRWQPGRSVGEALREAKRDMGGWDIYGEMEDIWTIEMHLYGDPKLGLGVGSSRSRHMGLQREGQAGLPETLRLETPDYEIHETPQGAVIRIKGGGNVLLPGYPPLPYFVHSIEIPKGTRVKDVSLLERKLGEVLELSLIPFGFGRLGKGSDGAKAYNFTLPPYRWRVIENPDGSSTLLIKIFPVEYNELTKRAEIYKSYLFRISYIETSVEIEGIGLDKKAYEPGEEVRAEGALFNSGGRADVIVESVLRSAADDEVVGEAPLLHFEGLAGIGQFSLDFSTEGLEPGLYYVEIVAKDTEGNILDRSMRYFRLGRKRIETFLSTLGKPEPWESFTAILRIANTGDFPISGEAHLLLKGGEEVVRNVTLEPGEEESIEHKFVAGGREATLIGYVLYEGRMSDPAILKLSFTSPPRAGFTYSPEEPQAGSEVIFTDTSEDPDGDIIMWKWDFGDGFISHERNPVHAYAEEGTYTVVLKVTDSEGNSSEFRREITVTEALPGDVNQDGQVNSTDLALVARAFGSTPGAANWNSDADLNDDGIIDIYDLVLAGSNFGRAGPIPWSPLPITKRDVGVITSLAPADPEEIAPYLPPDTDLSNAIVFEANVEDATPDNPADDAYTDITVDVNGLDVRTCRVFKEGYGFLEEVPDVTALPTRKDGNEPKFQRDIPENTITIRLYVGDPLLAVVRAGVLESPALAWATGPEGVLLRWFWPKGKLPRPKAYRVYRDGSLVAQVEKVVDEGEALDILGAELWDWIRSRYEVESIADLHELLDENPALEQWLSNLHYRVALIRGLGYLDDAAHEGETHRYGVEALLPGGQEVLGELRIEHKGLTPLPAPTGLMAVPVLDPNLQDSPDWVRAQKNRRAHARVFLRWDLPPEPTEGGAPAFWIPGYDVYRAVDPDGPYVRINEEPVIPMPTYNPPGLPEGVSYEKFGFYYVDADPVLQPCQTYYYRVAPRDLLGRAREWPEDQDQFSDWIAAIPPDTMPPPPPRNLEAVPDHAAGTITLTWDPVEDAAKYRVYRSTTPRAGWPGLLGVDCSAYPCWEEITPPDGIAATSWTDTTASYEQRYWYVVRAEDAPCGVNNPPNLSAPSQPVTAILHDRIPPAKPHVRSLERLRAIRVCLGSPLTDDDTIRFLVYASFDGGQEFFFWREIERPKGVSCIDFKPGEFYQPPIPVDAVFKFVAVDAHGNRSEFSDEVHCPLGPEEAPPPLRPYIVGIETLEGGIHVLIEVVGHVGEHVALVAGAVGDVVVGEDAAPAGCCGDLGHRLDGPDLVVDVHQGDQDGPCGHCGDHFPGIDHASRIHADVGGGHTLPFQEPAYFDHRRMFHGRGHYVVALSTSCQDRTDDGMVVGLGAAAREDDLTGVHLQQAGNLLPGVFHGRSGCLAEVVAAGRVPEKTRQEGLHGFGHTGIGGSRGVVVEIDGLGRV